MYHQSNTAVKMHLGILFFDNGFSQKKTNLKSDEIKQKIHDVIEGSARLDTSK